MEQRAVIFTFIGESIPSYALGQMAQVLTMQGITTSERINATVLNHEDLVKLLLEKAMFTPKIVKKEEDTEDPNSKWYPFEQAIIYLSKFYERHLHDDDTTFLIQASYDKFNHNLPKEYTTAVEILQKYTPLTRTASRILKKYNFKSEFVKILISVNKAVITE